MAESGARRGSRCQNRRGIWSPGAVGDLVLLVPIAVSVSTFTWLVNFALADWT